MMASVDEALLKPRSIADKLAALLPFGFWRKLWPHAHGGAGTAAGGAKTRRRARRRGAAVAPAAASSSISMGTAAIAAAVVAIAGAGGGVALTQGHSSHRPAPAHVSHAPAGAGAHGTGGTAGQPSRSSALTDHRSRPSVDVGGKSGGSAGMKAAKLHAPKLLGAKTIGGAGATNRGTGGSGGSAVAVTAASRPVAGAALGRR